MQKVYVAALRDNKDRLVYVMTSLLCNEGMRDVLELVQPDKQLMILQ